MECKLCETLLSIKDNKSARESVQEAHYFLECCGCRKLYALDNPVLFSIGSRCPNKDCAGEAHRHISGLDPAYITNRLVK